MLKSVNVYSFILQQILQYVYVFLFKIGIIPQKVCNIVNETKKNIFWCENIRITCRKGIIDTEIINLEENDYGTYQF